MASHTRSAGYPSGLTRLGVSPAFKWITCAGRKLRLRAAASTERGFFFFVLSELLRPTKISTASTVMTPVDLATEDKTAAEDGVVELKF